MGNASRKPLPPPKNPNHDSGYPLIDVVTARQEILARYTMLASMTPFKTTEGVNLMLIGEHHSGKSSLQNTIWRALKNENSDICDVGKRHGDSTTRYRRHKICDGLKIFDTPGLKFDTPKELQILPAYLKGLDTAVPILDLSRQDDLTIQNALKNAHQPKNEMHYAIVLIPAPRLEQQNNDQVDPHACKKYVDDVIVQVTQNGLCPYVIVTKSDELQRLKCQDIRVYLSNFVEPNKVFFIDSPMYIHPNENTCQVVFTLLRNIADSLISQYS